MVFLTAINCIRQITRFGRPGGGPDKFWRVRQFLRFSWKFTGRKRNCYGIGMRYVHKALMYGTYGRQQKKIDMRKLWETRLEAASVEHGIECLDLLEGLARMNVQLDRKVLSDLAMYEPRTFESLTEVVKSQMAEDRIASYRPSFWPPSVLKRPVQ